MSLFAVDSVRWLLPLAALALATAFALDYTRRRRTLERLGHVPQLERMMASLSPRRRLAKAVLRSVAILLVVAALGQPRCEGETVWKKRGIDLVVVMDFSKSMLARDVYPSRLERTRREVDYLFDELESDRVAVVTFAGAAAHFPLTHDHEAAASLYHGITPMDLPPGSALGEGIAMARCIMRPELSDEPGCAATAARARRCAPLGDEPDIEPAMPSAPRDDRGRAIVVFTDGEDTGDRARIEIQRATERGIKVILVGVGTRAGELIPELDEDGTEVGWQKTPDGTGFVTTRLEQAYLMELAELAGGPERYIHLHPERFGADELLEQLARVKKGDLDERVVKKPVQIFQFLLFPALLLLVIEACISERRRRVIYPERQP